MKDIVCSLLKSKENTWHTVIVLSNGPKAEKTAKPSTPEKLGERVLKNGMEGADVKELQEMLLKIGYSLGSFGADGEYGDATELAVKRFQKEAKIDTDGEVGPQTLKALKAFLEDEVVKDAKEVKIINGNCYVRADASTKGTKIGVAREGKTYTYLNETSIDGWNMIDFNGMKGWVSGKYSKLI